MYPESSFPPGSMRTGKRGLSLRHDVIRAEAVHPLPTGEGRGKATEPTSSRVAPLAGSPELPRTVISTTCGIQHRV